MTNTNDIVEQVKNLALHGPHDLTEDDLQVLANTIDLIEQQKNEIKYYQDLSDSLGLLNRKLMDCNEQPRIAELEALLYRVVNDLEYKCDIDGLRKFILAALEGQDET